MIQAKATDQAGRDAPPPPPDAPAVPVPPAPKITITNVGPGGEAQTIAIPTTQEQLQQLTEQRSQLSEQLSSVSARRRELAMEIRDATEGASRSGLESRLQILDQRILQLETDLAVTGRAIAAAPSELISSSSYENRGGGDDFEEGIVAGGFFSLMFAIPLVLYFARRRWKKGTVSKRSDRSELGGESVQRLERLEQGMESIAIEIERVSEGQRFVTRLLSEAAEPVGVSHRSVTDKSEMRQG